MFDREGLKERLHDLEIFDEHLSYMSHIGFDIEGKLMRPLFKSFENMMDLIAETYKDNEDNWIDYFVYENEFGLKANTVVVGKDFPDEGASITYTLDSVESFIDFFEKEVYDELS